ncbi:MAG TPA: hypothetical protein DDY95_03750, partial [Bacteroides sp.]|nr:hypothetical protein [Bacteroides sp.]
FNPGSRYTKQGIYEFVSWISCFSFIYIGLILGQFENLGSAEISAEPIFLPFHAELKWWEV